ncbi:MAG: hypothetical protein LBR68_06925 [Lachnoclostridium sp.]|jgi:hypothetical protein|nr:hypothetical protein [Lachnoclostridium sp.]
MDKIINRDAAFEAACHKIIHQEHLIKGIGTLKEKTIHAVLKNFLEPDEDKHEKRVYGFVADIVTEHDIIEIQTGNFNTMRRKLDSFLPEKKVTIVYPIPATKWLSWIDEETGEVTGRRKSPKRGSPYLAFQELYKIKYCLNHPNLMIHILLIDMEESRLLNGWSRDRKRGSVRYDRIPIRIVDEVLIERTEDYRMLIPAELGDRFSVKEYSKVTKLPIRQARTALHIMHYLKIVERVSKKGNAFIYALTSED